MQNHPRCLDIEVIAEVLHSYAGYNLSYYILNLR